MSDAASSPGHAPAGAEGRPAAHVILEIRELSAGYDNVPALTVIDRPRNTGTLS